VEALTLNAAPGAVDALVEIIRSRGRGAARRQALEALARNRSSQAREALEELASSRSRPRVSRSLRRLARRLVEERP
jgi:hypothetical protein